MLRKLNRMVGNNEMVSVITIKNKEIFKWNCSNIPIQIEIKNLKHGICL